MQRYPNCDFPINDATSSIARIADSVQRRVPFSFVRIGDGEGLLLSIDDQSTIEDLRHFGNYFGSARLRFQDLIRFRDEMRMACNDADLVGLRDDTVGIIPDRSWLSLPPHALERVVKERFGLRAVDKGLPAAAYRRLALTNKSLSETEFHTQATFTSAWLHWDLVTSGELYRMLDQQERIGIITSRSGLPALIEDFFSLSCRTYYVPDKFPAYPPTAPGAHYPRRFDELNEELVVDFPGMLFLVGAGACSKAYCRWIKARGGIGLDLGSVMDTWVGFGSRPAVMADRYGSSPKQGSVPEDLLLNRTCIDRLLDKADNRTLVRPAGLKGSG